VGGKTPLSAGLTLTHFVLQQEMRLHPEVAPLVSSSPMGRETSRRPASRRRKNPIGVRRNLQVESRTVVINMEHPAFDQGLAQKLADHLEAPCYSLKELKAESLYRTVRTS